jgi:protein-disulfide isomerase
MLVVAGVLVWGVVHSRRATSPPGPVVPAEPVSIEGIPILGQASAKVVLVEFSDFECPYCRQFASQVLPDLKRKYVDTGLVRFAFRQMPLIGIHPHAFRAAEATQCADSQGQFWSMHDRLFEGPAKLEDSDLRDVARQTGLDMSRFDTCLRGAAAERIRADIAVAQALKVTGTPTILFGIRIGPNLVRVRQVTPGAASLATLAPIVDGLLKEAS